MRRTLASVGSALGLVVAFQAPSNAAIGPVLQSCTIGKVAVVHWHQTKSAWMNIYWTFSYLQYPGNEHFPPSGNFSAGYQSVSTGQQRAYFGFDQRSSTYLNELWGSCSSAI